MTRNKLYIILAVACVAGYIWLDIAYLSGTSPAAKTVDVCLFKSITGIPCPSCGSTRTILALAKGDITGALHFNPMGLIVLLIMVVSPFWILFDVTLNRSTLLKFYNHMEIFLRRKWVAVPAIILVLVNWAWNIHKGL